MPIHHLANQLQLAFKNKHRLVKIPFSNTHFSISKILYDQGLITSFQLGDDQGPFQTEIQITPDNMHQRKVWLNLKYKEGVPVVQCFKAVSKPSRRVYASLQELQSLAAAKRVNSLIQRQVLGQITLLDTDYGILELKDALKKETGGEVLAVVY